jgi:hypothetical protein
MDKIEIMKAKNGWLVFIGGRSPHTENEPLVFTNWEKLCKYVKGQLCPEMKDS